MPESHPLTPGDKIAAFTLIVTIVLAIATNKLSAALQSAFLLIALGAAIYLCWKSLWASWKKVIGLLLLAVSYLIIVFWLFEQEAQAAKTVSPITTLAIASWGFVSSVPWRWVIPALLLGSLPSIVSLIRQSQESLPPQLSKTSIAAQQAAARLLAKFPNEAPDELLNIQSHVRVVGVSYEPEFNSAYIDFRFVIFNSSLYDIVFNKDVKGDSIRFGERWEKFHYRKVHLEPDGRVRCNARSGAWFIIRQSIRPEEGARFKENDYLVAFDHLVIEFHPVAFPDQVAELDLRQLYLNTSERAVRRLDNLDTIFMYSDEQWAALKNQEELNALRHQVRVLQEGMKTRKVIFQVDDTQSQVHITGGTNKRRLEASIRLRCEKAISDAVAIKEFHAALYQETSKGDTAIVEQEHAQVVWVEPTMEQVSMENGWTINEPLTPYRWFNFFLDIPHDVETKLDRDHFIRVSMLAVGQESRGADFLVDSWIDARQSNSTISIR